MPPVEIGITTLQQSVRRWGASTAALLREMPRVTEPDGSQWVDWEFLEELAIRLEKLDAA